MSANKNSIQKNIIWNTVGSLFYLMCQWLMTIAVVRFSNGYADAGVLSIAMSVTMIFSVFALFNVRNYQVSDSENLYSSGDYLFHRFFTCSLAFLSCAIFSLTVYDSYVALCIVAYMIVKVAEAFADVLHGEAQKNWRLDIAGKSNIIRGVLLITSFSLTLIFWKNLALSITVMAISNILPIIFYDFRTVKKERSIILKTDIQKLKKLTVICLPMVCYGICINAIVPFARCMLEYYHGEEALGYYASIATIAVLIQSLMTLIFTPLIGIFDSYYRANDKRRIVILLIKLFTILILVSVLAIAFSALIGEIALTFIFGEEISQYAYLLYPAIIISALSALVWLLGMLLIVMRDSKVLLIGALSGLIIAILLSVTLIRGTVYAGTNISVIAALSVIVSIYIFRFIIHLLSNKGTGEPINDK